MSAQDSSGRPNDIQVAGARQKPRGRAALPLFPPGRGDQPLVWRGDTPIPKRALVPDALAFLRTLPASAQIVNCCQDRYNFLVVLAACLLRGTPAILPHDARQSALLEIAERFQGALFVADHPLDAPRSVLRQVAFSGADAGRAQNPEIPREQTAAILFTSGSTGRALPVARSWQWLVEGANDYIAGLGRERLDGLTIVSTVPPQHSFGLEATALLPLRAPVSVRASRPFFPKDVSDALISARKPVALVTTPFHLELILRSNSPFPTLAFVLSATSPLSQALAREAEAAFRTRVLEVYGCSEVGLIGTRRTTLSELWTPGAGLTLRDTNGRTVVTAEHLPSPIPLPDAISLARDGSFRLGARSNDIVKIAGHRASLAGLIATLNAIPGVVDGTIVTRPGETAESRTRLAGFVVLSGRGIAEVRRELRASIAGPFMPRPLLEVAELPRGATGKVMLEPLLALIGRKTSPP
jgi:acyl-coenzyme A synthetase/AMP-(fatty) acid ligase